MISMAAGAVMGAALWVATSAFGDALAERVVLYSAAGTGLLWLWRNLLRPVSKVLHRLAKSVEALEDLPRWRDATDLRIEDLEIGQEQVKSGVSAILRELGLEDKVRRMHEGEMRLEQMRERRAEIFED